MGKTSNTTNGECALEQSILSATTPRELSSIFALIRARTHEHPHEANRIIAAYETRVEQIKADLDQMLVRVRKEIHENKIVP